MNIPLIPTTAKTVYPVLPVRDIVVFPDMIVPLFVGRKRSVLALNEAVRKANEKLRTNKSVLMLTQKQLDDESPTPEDLYSIGAIGNILQMFTLPDDTVKVLVEGTSRAAACAFSDTGTFLQAQTQVLEDVLGDPGEMDTLCRSALTLFEQYGKVSRKVSPDVLSSAAKIEHPGRLADAIAGHLALKLSARQELLSSVVVQERLEKTIRFMETEIGMLQVEKRVRSRVKKQMEKTQKEYYLNEQLKAIQRELDSIDSSNDEVSQFARRIKQVRLSKEAHEKATLELKKLSMMNGVSAESTVVRNYLDWLLSLPWSKRSRCKKDLTRASEILEADHYGLDKIKERILEYVAVLARMRKMKGAILCLVGPPGVGKTSLGQSIARAVGRKFVRMSLGGVRDESEIRGHRRTYIGSMPGRIVQSMKKAKVINPLFLLDEVDKIGSDWRGDPASALLEVLDPEQNKAFSDHYLEVDYDLSDVMFIATANSVRIPPALLDRMEVLHIAGYTEEEKIEIAKRHLIPKLSKEHGLREGEWSLSPAALRDLVRLYTREAGVRSLEKELAKLIRKAVKRITLGKCAQVRVTYRNIDEFLGPPLYRRLKTESKNMIGVATGLAWTEVGGEILMIEAVSFPGKGRVSATGKLGEVMKESIQAAEYFVKSRASTFGIPRSYLETRDVHLHVPEGATPKDGPSAGIAMAVAIISVLSQVPVRCDTAMTGEITLRGRVLPVGGLKEKLLAALRGQITRVLIPQENVKNLVEIPDNVKKGLQIIPVDAFKDVLAHTLERKVEPIEWTPLPSEIPPPPPPSPSPSAEQIAH